MPIYEYACDSCNSRFEVRQKLSDPPVVACSKCGNAVKKLISSPAIMFKGSGWYITDYSDKMKPPTGEGGEGKPKPEATTPAGEAKTASSGTGNGTAGATPGSTPASSSSRTSSGGSNTPSTPTNSSSSS